MNKIYLATQIIGDTYSQQVIGQNADITVWLVHKLKHTFGVAHDIMDILYKEKDIYNFLTDEERELVELSALFHDLGRFYQHKDGRHLSNSEFDHGQYAVDLLKEDSNFNNPIILFAIGEHNKFAINYDNPYYQQLSEHDKRVAEITAKLLRDADKLENIKDVIYHGIPRLIHKFPSLEPLSENVKLAVKNKKSVLRSDMKTSSDRVVDYLAWVYDINYQSTKDSVKNLNFIETGIKFAKLLGATDEDCELLKEYIRL
ncbi:MAG: HD domain-containing protein [bacterium]|nr:HD domain-containing protein [bacterium]